MAVGDSGSLGEGEGRRDERMERLRRLILQPEQDRLLEILERLDDRQVRTREIGEVLPGAVRHSSREGSDLEDALGPTFGRVVHRLIRRDRKAFADALFPVMGPAIRKSIAEALKGMVQTLNQALEYSLSWKGLKWRLEALRTGRSFGEIVLSKTLVYRVEQAFLIHRESGLLLLHVVDSAAEAQDADLVSGMLTAIQDFVRDGFRVEDEGALQTMEVGDLNIWVERGPEADLALAIRGGAPAELRTRMHEALEVIHGRTHEELADFSGDISEFESVRPVVEECFESRTIEEETGTGSLLWILIALLCAVGGWWLFAHWREGRALDTYLAALEGEAGIVVTRVEPAGRGTVIRGLRDPLAADPLVVLEDLGLNSATLRPSFRPYISLDDSLVLERAHRALGPPPNVRLEQKDGVLTVSGIAPASWVERARGIARTIPGVLDFQEEIEGIDEALLAKLERIETLRMRIETVIEFDVNSTEIGGERAALLADTVAEIMDLIQLAGETGRTVSIAVCGHPDVLGPPELNLRLSRERVATVVGELEAGGVPGNRIEVVGRGSLLGEDGVGAGPVEKRRSVTLSVSVGDGKEPVQ